MALPNSRTNTGLPGVENSSNDWSKLAIFLLLLCKTKVSCNKREGGGKWKLIFPQMLQGLVIQKSTKYYQNFTISESAGSFLQFKSGTTLFVHLPNEPLYFLLSFVLPIKSQLIYVNPVGLSRQETFKRICHCLPLHCNRESGLPWWSPITNTKQGQTRLTSEICWDQANQGYPCQPLYLMKCISI